MPSKTVLAGLIGGASVTSASPAEISIAFDASNACTIKAAAGGTLESNCCFESSKADCQEQLFQKATDDCAQVRARTPAATSGAYPMRRPTTSNPYNLKDVYCRFEGGRSMRLLYQTAGAAAAKAAENPTYVTDPISSFAYRTIYFESTDIADPNTACLKTFFHLGFDAKITAKTDILGANPEGKGEQFRAMSHGGCPNADPSADACYYFDVPPAEGDTTNFLSNKQLYATCGASGWEAYSNGAYNEVYVVESSMSMESRMQALEVAQAFHAKHHQTFAGRDIGGNQEVNQVVRYTEGQTTLHIKAGMNHYGFLNGHGCVYEAFIGTCSGCHSWNFETKEIFRHDSATSGAWSVIRGDDHQSVIVKKSAGNYGGGGSWFIDVVQSS